MKAAPWAPLGPFARLIISRAPTAGITTPWPTGVDPKRAIAEVLGKAPGFAKGKGGSMHFVDPSLGLMGANGIVGAQVPHAGMALAPLRSAAKTVCAITSLGNGALYQGLMHETFNMSEKWKLPVIFYCENNRYSEMTPISRTSSVSEIFNFVKAYGMNSVQIDGNDVEVVYATVSEAVERARRGEGPTFIEGLTYRLAGHIAGDLETYRPAEEIEMQKQYEPLTQLHQLLIDRGAGRMISRKSAPPLRPRSKKLSNLPRTRLGPTSPRPTPMLQGLPGRNQDTHPCARLLISRRLTKPSAKKCGTTSASI